MIELQKSYMASRADSQLSRVCTALLLPRPGKSVGPTEPALSQMRFRL
jgi:hypothetical protein